MDVVCQADDERAMCVPARLIEVYNMVQLAYKRQVQMAYPLMNSSLTGVGSWTAKGPVVGWKRKSTGAV